MSSLFWRLYLNGYFKDGEPKDGAFWHALQMLGLLSVFILFEIAILIIYGFGEGPSANIIYFVPLMSLVVVIVTMFAALAAERGHVLTPFARNRVRAFLRARFRKKAEVAQKVLERLEAA